MSIWNKPTSMEELNTRLAGNMCEHVGIEITEVGDDYLKATMPVDHRTTQYMGIVHGGASVVLAETLGSLASYLCCQPGYYSVGLEVNANHMRPGKPPLLTATARPLHLGRATMVWDIKIHDSDNKLVCVSRLTTAVLKAES